MLTTTLAKEEGPVLSTVPMAANRLGRLVHIQHPAPKKSTTSVLTVLLT